MFDCFRVSSGLSNFRFLMVMHRERQSPNFVWNLRLSSCVLSINQPANVLVRHNLDNFILLVSSIVFSIKPNLL